MAELKFPVLKDIDYIDISRNKETKLSLNSPETNGLKWRDLQKLIGQKCGAGNYHYQLKQVDKNKIHVGMIKAIGGAPPTPKPGESSKIKSIEDSISLLTNKIESLHKGSGVSVEMLIEVTKTNYEMRIGFIEGQLTEKKNELVLLQSKLEDKEAEIIELEEEIKESSGFDKYFEIGKKILDAKALVTGVKSQPLANLQDSNPSDIPPAIIDSLGVVDWLQVDPGKVEEIVVYLNMFIPKLPMKGTTHG